MDDSITPSAFLTIIRSGVYDDFIDDIEEALNERKKAIFTPAFQEAFNCRAKSILDFKVGDRVRFNMDALPKYLHGLTAMVTKVNQTRVKVQMPATAGRFANHVVACPISIIDKV